MITGSLVKQIGRPSATGPMSDVSSVTKSVVIEKDHGGRGGFSMAAFFFHGRSSEAHRASDGVADMYGGSKVSKRAPELP